MRQASIFLRQTAKSVCYMYGISGIFPEPKNLGNDFNPSRFQLLKYITEILKKDTEPGNSAPEAKIQHNSLILLYICIKFYHFSVQYFIRNAIYISEFAAEMQCGEKRIIHLNFQHDENNGFEKLDDGCVLCGSDFQPCGVR